MYTYRVRKTICILHNNAIPQGARAAEMWLGENGADGWASMMASDPALLLYVGERMGLMVSDRSSVSGWISGKGS